MNHATTVDAQLGVLGIHHRKLGMWLFLASEVMFFTGLIGAYIVLRSGSTAWPVPSTILNVPLTAFNTFILICSSVTMVQSLAGIQQGDQRKLQRMLLATFVLGAAFLGIQAYEYNKLIGHGLTLTSSMFGSCFYVLTGFHGFHVSVGVIFLCIVARKVWRGDYDNETRGFFTSRKGNYEIVETMGLYWHFVDLVWVFIFALFYLW